MPLWVAQDITECSSDLMFLWQLATALVHLGAFKTALPVQYQSVLLFTTKYDSSTNLHYTKRLQYYNVQKTQTANGDATEAAFRTRQEQILLKIKPFPSPGIIPNFTTCCAGHKKWHTNFTNCCTCHKKWHMNFTKWWPVTKKWTSPNIAPVTQNESYDWNILQMKRHLQYAEQQTTPSNLSKNCACHA